MPRSCTRIPGLDGLRAISIALVVLGHLFNRIQAPGSSPFWMIVGNAGLGVMVFFVISGFLITTLLLREFETNHSINLRNFYVRRIFRIFPPFYAYLIALATLATSGWLVLAPRDLLSAVTFTVDYSAWRYPSWPIQHAWSLSVEEQFYLLWPWLLVYTLVKGGKMAAAKAAGALILLAPVLRVASHFSGNAYLADNIYFTLHTRIDSLMFGCTVALLTGADLFEGVYNVVCRAIGIFPVFVLVGSPLLGHYFGGAYTYVLGYTLDGAAIAFVMIWLVRNPKNTAGRILNSRPMVHIGVMSYSIYLWQQLFLHVANRSVFARFPLNLICIAVTAELSYYVIEKRFLRWRKAFERTGTVNRAPLATEVSIPA